MLTAPRMHKRTSHDSVEIPHGIGLKRQGMSVVVGVGLVTVTVLALKEEVWETCYGVCQLIVSSVIHLIIIVETQGSIELPYRDAYDHANYSECDPL